MKAIKSIFINSFVSCIFLIIILGGVYPYTCYILGNLFFHDQINGSLIYNRELKIQGSRLIGQEFKQAKYFWGRPSATQPPYNPVSSSASNDYVQLHPYKEKIKERVLSLRKIDPLNLNQIPIELVTASASGLDPHLSLESVLYQTKRIAKIRGLDEYDLNILIKQHLVDSRFFFCGGPLINVVELNLALDNLK